MVPNWPGDVLLSIYPLCDAPGLPTRTGDCMHGRRQYLGYIRILQQSGANAGHPKQAVVLSISCSAPHELDTRTHAHRPAKRAGRLFWNAQATPTLALHSSQC
jgi:hypothetical protein